MKYFSTVNEFKEQLNEANGDDILESGAGLSRMLSRIKGNDFCTLSGFRKDVSFRENRAKNTEIYRLFHKLKMGAYHLIGHWKELPDGISSDNAKPEDYVPVEEESFLVIRPESMSADEFIQMMKDLGEKYNQDAVLLSIDGRVYFWDCKAHVEYTYSGGNNFKFTTQDLADAYSRLRKRSDQFVFDSID